MAQFIDFLGVHWVLTSLWLFFFAALIFYSRSKSGQTVGIHEMTQLINHKDALVLDIRPEKEFGKGHVVNARNIPLAKLKDRLKELDKHKENPIVVVCNLGNQSGEGVNLLNQAGFSQVSRLRGGITEWRSQGLPLVTK